jgi:hypothetical protein
MNFTACGNHRLRADLRRFETNQISFVSHRYLQLRLSLDLRVVRYAAWSVSCRRPRGGGVKRLYQVAGDLRFADVAGCSQILGGSNEVYALVNGEKDDAGGASAASQLFRDSKATYIAQIHVQENDVCIQSGGFFKY